MEQLNQSIDFIQQHNVLLFLIYILFSFISATIIDKIFIVGLKFIVKKTKTDVDDKLIEVLHPAIYNSILYSGFYLAINTTIIDYPKVIFILSGILKTVIVIYWSFGLFNSFIIIIKWFSSKETDKSFIKKKTIPLFDNLGKIIIFLFSI